MPTPLRQQKHSFGSLRTDPHWSVQGLKFYSQFKPAGVLIDETSNKNHGILIGSPIWAGKGLNFDRDNDYVNIGEITPTTAYTKIAWVRRTFTSGAGNIISGDTDNVFWISGTPFKVSAGHNPFDQVIDPDVLTLNVWFQVAVTYDSGVSGGTLVLYKDGVAIDSATSIGVHSDPTTQIGAYLGGTFWGGQIDDVSIYNRALSANEIQQLYINPDLPMQDEPIWLLFSPSVGGSLQWILDGGIGPSPLKGSVVR